MQKTTASKPKRSTKKKLTIYSCSKKIPEHINKLINQLFQKFKRNVNNNNHNKNFQRSDRNIFVYRCIYNEDVKIFPLPPELLNETSYRGPVKFR